MKALLLCVAMIGADEAGAQPAAANAAGVAMGHIHYHVADVEANKAFWTALGGTPGLRGDVERVYFPGLIVMLSHDASGRQAAGSRVDHVAFRVESLDGLEARGLKPEYNTQFPGIGVLYTPGGDKVELFEEGTATNIGFETAEGMDTGTADRHNRPLSAAIATHHLHFYLDESQVSAARDWYVEHFGAIPGTRWRYTAADLPGMNLNFSPATATLTGTAGHSLDHIGLEIDDLEAFCRQLQANGVQLDEPFRLLPSGLGLATLTDPWGTRIELTEGLR